MSSFRICESRWVLFPDFLRLRCKLSRSRRRHQPDLVRHRPYGHASDTISWVQDTTHIANSGLGTGIWNGKPRAANFVSQVGSAWTKPTAARQHPHLLK